MTAGNFARDREPGPADRRGSGSRATLIIGLGAVGVYFVIPGGSTQDLMYSGIGLAATVVMALAILRHKPSERRGWWCLTAANACFVLGDGVYTFYNLALHRNAPFPSVADALYLAGYPFLVVGVLQISRLRGRPGARESWADAAIVSVGALALSWQFLMGSYAHDRTLSPFGKVVTLAYPVMDIGVLFITVSALMVSAGRRTSDKLLAIAVLAMVVGDFIYDFLVLHSSYATGNPVDAAYLINYVLLAAAARHPSDARAPADRVGAETDRVWLPLVALAAFVSPTILLVGSVFHVWVDVGLLAGTTIALIALGILRAAWLFDRLRSQAVQLQRHGASLQEALAAQHSLEADLRHGALHDRLTGLANRALLDDRIEHALASSVRRRAAVAVCVCDLDGFKSINDSLGHNTGDDLLISVAQRLGSIVRAGDTVTRLGGDEFAILLESVESIEAVEVLAGRMVAVLAEPANIQGRQLYVTASIGVAFASAGATPETLLSEADAAMYAAKAAGKNRFAVFESEMRSQINDRVTLLNSFQDALTRHDFHLEFQPQHRLPDGALEGFEALVRWPHPDLGLVGPDRFIPLAEETGFIIPLGRWILEQACLQAAEWPDGPQDPLSISVNLSARQLQDPNLFRDVRSALSASGLSPTRLVLEITETVLMNDPTSAAGLLTRFKAMGIRIAVDDFGTGYSALSYLRQFPADILKIDKSFIDPLDGDDGTQARAFVQAILQLARDLDLHTTAEGIERQAQRDILTALECSAIQGYLMSRPLGHDATHSYIAAQTDTGRAAVRRVA